MIAIRRILRTLGVNTRGATAIEYGLIAALIAIASMAGMASLGGGSGGMWTKLSDHVEDAAPGP